MMGIVARIRKRLRVLWAAWTQSWHTHRCVECSLAWHCEGDACRHYAPVERCIWCEHMQFERLMGSRVLPWSGRAS